MELYIRLQNGQPVDHPIIGDNFRQAFPDVDVNNLPDWVARFERVEKPMIGIYEVYGGVTYEWSNEIVKDVHNIRPMNEEEKLQKQAEVKEQWAQNPGWISWVFNEENCSFAPPIPYPNDGTKYFWDESTISWKLLP